jgi:foldase protein PrsA
MKARRNLARDEARSLPSPVVPRISRLLPALCAFFVLTFVLSACGSDSVPGNSVASVDGSSITKSDFDRWMRIAAISTQSQQGGNAASVAVPAPPAYTACIANKRKTAPKPAKGQRAPTTAQLKTQCKQEYEGLRDQVLQFLINYKWVSGEAGDRDVKVSDAEVNKEIATTRKQSFPKDADFQKFLKDSGLTLQDIRFQVRLNQLQNKLRDKISKDTGKVDSAAIGAYYKKNRARFAQPERRDLRVVLTKQKGRADAAKAALQSGQSWKAVAKEYSIDQASKAQGGTLLGVAKGQQEQSLDRAVFAAKKGNLVGPVKTQFGYYVFQVQKVTAPSQQSLKEATPAIRQLLTAQNAQKAEQQFGKDFKKKWKSKTKCKTGFKVSLCDGEKDPPAQTAPAGAAPQQGGGAAPQGGAPTPTP